ncbi:unnamed protein product [Diatraea saccharalis]|uniref:Uncharacterized protein n=1 Tax=Diatraea saccharalis TaxID=40085 RepID=A0A9N9R3F4_9NEOP|nr:unnamed protein product [Diatraea saccharalis]
MTDTTSEISSENTEIKKPAKDIPVVHDQGFFQHETGDTYDGYFEAKKKDRVAKMHGPGTYITAEGDTYTGVWEADRLGANEEVTILYKDGAVFEGAFRDWSYNGRGRYYYPDGSILKCEFSESAPVGSLNLTDPNGHIWLGKADQGFGWLKPVNHFYDMLEKTRDTGKVKKSNKKSRNE